MNMIIGKRPDLRIVYGAQCTWWDSIDQVGHVPNSGSKFNPNGLPCCPHCGRMLFEVDSIEQWQSGIDRYEGAGHPGYAAMMAWARGKCFPNMAALESAYREELSA